MKYQCLMIDDDITIAETTAEYFNLFDIKTAFVNSFAEAEAFLSENEVSLVLLDINLGQDETHRERNGYELCKKIRQSYDMPILFISARTGDDDILAALNIGGDDYITKPFSLSILLAKVKAILKRCERTAEKQEACAAPTEAQNLPASARIEIAGQLYLDTASHQLLRQNTAVPLKTMEYKMLLYLLENRGRVVTKDEFLEKVWENPFVGEGTLAVHIRHLREKIEQDLNAPVVIKTVWGVGYIIENTGESNQTK